MDPPDFAFAIALDNLIRSMTWFWYGWTAVYCTLGVWLLIRLAQDQSERPAGAKRRFGPVLILHLLISGLCVNPYVTIRLVFTENPLLSIGSGIVLGVLLSFLLNVLLFRCLPRLRWCRWLEWRPRLPRLAGATLAVTFLGGVGGLLGLQLKEARPYFVRSFPLHPEGAVWNVKTGMRSLEDFSVAAESDRIVVDGSFACVRVESRRNQWVVIDTARHRVTEDGPQYVAYVKSEDGVGPWQLEESAPGFLCRRFPGGKAVAVPLELAEEVVFLPRQQRGVIVGANSRQGELFAFDPVGGKVAWRVSPQQADDRRIGCLAASGDVLAVGLWSSALWAVEVDTGRTRWFFHEQRMGSSMHVLVTTNLAIGFSRSGKTYAFDLSTGQARWIENLGDHVGGNDVCLTGERLFMRQDDNTLTCVAAASGQRIWQVPLENDGLSGGISFSDGRVACASDRTVVLMDAETGKNLWQTKLPVGRGRGYCSGSRVEDKPGQIYAPPIADAAGQVYYAFVSDGRFWALQPTLAAPMSK